LQLTMPRERIPIAVIGSGRIGAQVIEGLACTALRRGLRCRARSFERMFASTDPDPTPSLRRSWQPSRNGPVPFHLADVDVPFHRDNRHTCFDEADNASVFRAYEGKIAKLEREKLLLTEKAAQIVPPKGRLEAFLDHALTFLGNPRKLYENGGFAFDRTVLKPAFAEPLRYSRDNGYRTAKII